MTVFLLECYEFGSGEEKEDSEIYLYREDAFKKALLLTVSHGKTNRPFTKFDYEDHENTWSDHESTVIKVSEKNVL